MDNSYLTQTVDARGSPGLTPLQPSAISMVSRPKLIQETSTVHAGKNTQIGHGLGATLNNPRYPTNNQNSVNTFLPIGVDGVHIAEPKREITIMHSKLDGFLEDQCNTGQYTKILQFPYIRSRQQCKWIPTSHES